MRLGDVADVVLGADNYEMDVRMSGDRAVFMGVWVLPNANALDVIKRVRAELAKVQSELPTGLTAPSPSTPPSTSTTPSTRCAGR